MMSTFTNKQPSGRVARADTPMADFDMTANTSRYPKRKRADVHYAPLDDSEDEWQSDEEYDSRSSKKSKQTPKMLPKHKIFPFMNLPAELRNKIYGFALSDVGGVFLTSKSKGYRRLAQRCIESECEPQYTSRFYRYRGHNDDNNDEAKEAVERRTFAPNLLAVCKTIHAEAGSFLYSQPITVADNYALLAWLNQIGSQHIKMLRDLTINQWCGGRAHKSINFPALAMLIPATGLRRLSIACTVGYFSSYGWRNGKKQEIAHRVARKVFRDCYPFLEAVGRAKGDMAAAVKLVDIDEHNFSQASGDTETELASFQKELRRLLST